jgi:LacI family transcriptional regulator
MVTIREIAKAAGVSAAAVSRVLNNDTSLSVSAATRQTILETAEALQYVTPRNRKGGTRAMPRRGEGPLAQVFTAAPEEEFSDPYYLGVRFGIEARCRELGIETRRLYEIDSNNELASLADARGIVIVTGHRTEKVDWLCQTFANVAIVGVRGADHVDSVTVDLQGAMQRVLLDIHALGYRRIGYVGGPDRSYLETRPRSEERAVSFIRTMTELGLFDPALFLVSDHLLDFQSGHDLTLSLFASGNMPELLITGNDSMAIGAYRALHECGLKIPDDISVVSFNDIPAAQFMVPSLSTLKIYSEFLGMAGVDLVMERLAGRDIAKRVTIATEMIWRESSRRP